jgi:uncharacterized protein DUF5615
VKFKIDENLPINLAEDLHLAGHDADTVRDENPMNSHAGVVLFRPGMSGRVAVVDFIRSRLSELLILDSLVA